ncbi:hypothetical protein JI59_24715 (plasmid) [Novosphingobium pentaromativorans US6-1]|nr:hypothetical protein JI59_24715 [Novosphingobium pentaromativorans US6-1]
MINWSALLKRSDHGGFTAKDSLCLCQNFVHMLLVEEHDAASIRHNPVPGVDHYAADCDSAAPVMLRDPTARCKRNNCATEDWETKLAAFIQIATSAVDDHAGNAFPCRGPAQQATPARGIGPSAMLDDHDLTRLCRHDGRGPQVPFG